MGDEPAGVEHLAGDLGVDAFVPVGEAVMAEQGEDDNGGEERGECRRADGLARVGFARWLELRCHEHSLREVRCFHEKTNPHFDPLISENDEDFPFEISRSQVAL